MPNSMAAAPHHPQQLFRTTSGGRTLRYDLQVIQQPERARACGSGPKSSADRRPVDPPPVIELRVFEVHSQGETDITFSYNANFFLFATLEHARVMAHGRVQTPSANTPPVLTGVPVAGVSYLDRPREAGYFIFADLSVRHEGRYRLTFDLYEETKEVPDMDPGSAEKRKAAMSAMTSGAPSFDYRMQVKSDDFVVWSAKKFPGLSSSTPLSRLVADQGCRVRIRRDVRMRRREGKPRDGDYEEGDGQYARRRPSATPEVQPEPSFAVRQRTASNESVVRTPYSTADMSRRPSVVEYPPPPPLPSTQLPTQPPPPGHYLAFGSVSSGPAPPPPHQHNTHSFGSVSSGPAPPPPHQHNSHSSIPPSPSYPSSHMASFAQPSCAPPPPPLPSSIYPYGDRPVTQDSRRTSGSHMSITPTEPKILLPSLSQTLGVASRNDSLSGLPPLSASSSGSMADPFSAPASRMPSISMISPITDRAPQRSLSYNPGAPGPVQLPPPNQQLPPPHRMFYETTPSTGKRRMSEFRSTEYEVRRYTNWDRDDGESYEDDDWRGHAMYFRAEGHEAKFLRNV